MNAKLKIEMSGLLIEAEGSEKFVRDLYADFKDKLKLPLVTNFASGADGSAKLAKKPQTTAGKKPPAGKTKPASKSSSATSTIDVDASLDTHGLKEYYSRYIVNKDADRALIFAKFLTEKGSIAPITKSHIHTCFFALKTELKLPDTKSVFTNDRARTKFFSCDGDEVSITQIGENHFNHDLKRADSSD